MISILGDSHARAYEKALEREGAALVATLSANFGTANARMLLPGYSFFEEFYTLRDGAVAFARHPTQDAEGFTLELDPEHLYGFSFGFHTAVILREEYWAHYAIVPGIPGKAYISAAVFREMVLNENKYILNFARDMKKRGMRFFFIAAPPVRQALLDRTAGISSAEEIFAIRNTYCRIMSEAFDEIGVPYLMPPDSVTKEQVLKPKYNAIRPHDVHHANPKYGALLWTVILEKFGNRDPAGA